MLSPPALMCLHEVKIHLDGCTAKGGGSPCQNLVIESGIAAVGRPSHRAGCIPKAKSCHDRKGSVAWGRSWQNTGGTRGMIVPRGETGMPAIHYWGSTAVNGGHHSRAQVRLAKKLRPFPTRRKVHTVLIQF